MNWVVEKNPLIQGGEPVVKGSGLMTRTIRERFLGGDGVAAMAADYDIEPEAIECALRYELSGRRYKGNAARDNGP